MVHAIYSGHGNHVSILLARTIFKLWALLSSKKIKTEFGGAVFWFFTQLYSVPFGMASMDGDEFYEQVPKWYVSLHS